MKRILITGANSYIGTSFEKYIAKFGNDYQVDTIDMHGDAWREVDFSGYDSIIHVAGIVHVKERNDELYYQVNRDLAFETAKKAKEDGAKQFIFFSSMSIFGLDTGVITNTTKPNPKTPYGKSKLAAEGLLKGLEAESFIVCILRPPMIYGPNSVGNYPKLAKLAKKIPVFPKVNNQRSMLYIGNLSAFLKLMIDTRLSGTFHPQNKEYANTSEMVKLIAEAHDRNLLLLPGFSGVIKLASTRVGVLRKVFGSLIYQKNTVGFPDSKFHHIKLEYQDKNFKNSIFESENK
ncbi:NAD-dependent epimerase/dehydratase family protein [Enterococcus asini]|uniref:NAD-dependent epimerase/dehydratase family protein n=1 Tax=Enterococcus asini TaxID=57732 RepID=UPI0028902E84|nr:NAD-dependent epimerase/dehydratase family protein [Enterococcus asini]MDT2757483.1 NAD-dependent epimerase/dehydratase family protein [Enterococcus asini]